MRGCNDFSRVEKQKGRHDLGRVFLFVTPKTIIDEELVGLAIVVALFHVAAVAARDSKSLDEVSAITVKSTDTPVPRTALF